MSGLPATAAPATGAAPWTKGSMAAKPAAMMRDLESTRKPSVVTVAVSVRSGGSHRCHGRIRTLTKPRGRGQEADQSRCQHKAAPAHRSIDMRPILLAHQYRY